MFFPWSTILTTPWDPLHRFPNLSVTQVCNHLNSPAALPLLKAQSFYWDGITGESGRRQSDGEFWCWILIHKCPKTQSVGDYQPETDERSISEERTTAPDYFSAKVMSHSHLLCVSQPVLWTGGTALGSPVSPVIANLFWSTLWKKPLTLPYMKWGFGDDIYVDNTFLFPTHILRGECCEPLQWCISLSPHGQTTAQERWDERFSLTTHFVRDLPCQRF